MYRQTANWELTFSVFEIYCEFALSFVFSPYFADTYGGKGCDLIKFPINQGNFFDFAKATTDAKVAMESSYMIYMNQGCIIFNAITSICLLVSVIATIFSGYEYLKDGKDLFKD